MQYVLLLLILIALAGCEKSPNERTAGEAIVDSVASYTTMLKRAEEERRCYVVLRIETPSASGKYVPARDVTQEVANLSANEWLLHSLSVVFNTGYHEVVFRSKRPEC